MPREGEELGHTLRQRNPEIANRELEKTTAKARASAIVLGDRSAAFVDPGQTALLRWWCPRVASHPPRVRLTPDGAIVRADVDCT